MIRAMIRPMIRPMIRSVVGFGSGDVDPVPDFLVRYLLNGTDSATPINSPTSVVAPALSDKLGYDFNGVDQYIDADVDSSIVAFGSGAFSIAFWVKFSRLSVNERFISTGSASNGSTEFEIFHDGAGKVRFRHNNTATNIVPDGSAATGTWQHVAVTMSAAGGVLKGYLNGVEVKSGGAPAYNIQDSGFLRLASRPTGDLKTQGAMDDVRIYGRVLTPADVLLISDNV